MSVIEAPARGKVLWPGLLIGAAIVFAGAYLASPFVGLVSLFSAARAGDARRLEQLVDFPAVRAGLKAQISATLAEQRPNDPQPRPQPSVGQLPLSSYMDRAIDAYVTPQAIATMVRNAGAPARPGQEAADSDAATDAISIEAKGVDVRPRFAYLGVNRFRASLENAAKPTEALVLVFERRGAFNWRLTRIDLPASALRSVATGAQPAS